MADVYPLFLFVPVYEGELSSMRYGSALRFAGSTLELAYIYRHSSGLQVGGLSSLTLAEARPGDLFRSDHWLQVSEVALAHVSYAASIGSIGAVGGVLFDGRRDLERERPVDRWAFPGFGAVGRIGHLDRTHFSVLVFLAADRVPFPALLDAQLNIRMRDRFWLGLMAHCGPGAVCGGVEGPVSAGINFQYHPSATSNGGRQVLLFGAGVSGIVGATESSTGGWGPMLRFGYEWRKD